MAVSPQFTQDQTVIMGSNYRQLLISEDAGETWFPLRGFPVLGGGDWSQAAALVHEKGLLLPLASTPNAVFRYRWPKLRDVPTQVTFCLLDNSTSPLQATLPLIPDDIAPVPWGVEEGAGWLAAAPISGTLPATLTLTVEPGAVPGGAETEVAVRVYWSMQQVTTDTVTIVATYDCPKMFLPLVVRNR
jgi:hypothetical protein